MANYVVLRTTVAGDPSQITEDFVLWFYVTTRTFTKSIKYKNGYHVVQITTDARESELKQRWKSFRRYHLSLKNILYDNLENDQHSS